MVTALSVAMAWLYWRTEHSLLLTMLMHASINNTKDVVATAGSRFGAGLTVAVLGICAVFFLFRMRGGSLNHPEPVAAEQP